MTPSKYQQEIYARLLTTPDNLIVVARAGSGKTTTMVQGVQKARTHTLCVAFGKEIADSMKPKLPPGAESSTLNAFGWSICRKNLHKVRLHKYKTDAEVQKYVPRTDKANYYKTLNPIKQIVGLLKAHFLTDLSQVDWLVDRFDIDDYTPEIRQLLERIYPALLADTATMDFDDQIFMPVYLGLPVPPYKHVWVDEAQDLNNLQIEFLKRTKARVMCVGDPQQAIYGFRGADPEAMSRLKSIFDCTELPLSICYRCSKAVVQEAQRFVPEIEAWSGAKEGVVDSVTGEPWKPNDFVICRTTAPLVSKCLATIRKGVKAYVRGRDIGDKLSYFVDKYSGCNDNMPAPEFLDIMERQVSESLKILADQNKNFQMDTLEDNRATIDCLAESCVTVSQIKGKIDEIFKPCKDSVIFLTGHKAKGLETDNVYILRPDLMPHPKAKSDFQKEQELNLQYVVTTRAKDKLFYVEKDS